MKTKLLIGLAAVVTAGALAQNVAVRFYRAGNPGGFPPGWPAEERDMGVNRGIPPGFDTNLTRLQYETVIANRTAAIQAWRTTNDVAKPQSNRVDRSELLRAALKNWNGLDFDQKDRVLQAVVATLVDD